jgi:hypothetical protein
MIAMMRAPSMIRKKSVQDDEQAKVLQRGQERQVQIKVQEGLLQL